MSKKKILLLILLIVLVILIAFLVVTFRKFIIVKNMQSKIAMKEQNSNYYRKTTTTGEQGETITEAYVKDNKKFVSIKKISNDKEEKILLYDNGTTINVYREIGDEKTFIPNGSSEIVLNLTNWLETFNDYHTFICCIKAKITETVYEGKECYVIKNFEEPNLKEEKELYIEKETGLCLKSTIMNQTSIIEYEFDNVSDEIFTEPDMNLYQTETK